MPSRDRVSMTAQDMLARYDDELTRIPDSGILHHGRGIALASLDRRDEAQKAFERAFALAPRHVDILVSLGELYVTQKNALAARAAFLKALSIDDLTPRAWEGFSRVSNFFSRWTWKRRLLTLQHQQWKKRRAQSSDAGQVIAQAARLGKSKHHAEAIDVVRKFLEGCPGHVDATATLYALLAGLGNVAQGKAGLERLVTWWPKNAAANYCLGVYLITTGERDAGIASLQRALVLDPKNENARFALATIGASNTPQVEAKEVRGIFDAYADKFDHDLQDNLQYRVPEMIGEIVGNSGRRRTLMLDLGCGTGLCGERLHPYVDKMIGVDLSEKMLAKARERRIYDVLAHDEAVSYLERTSETYDLVVAADVLVYIGDLSALFPAVAARLEPQGEFWFSIELSPQDGFRVTMSRRYQHSLGYLETMARASSLRIMYQKQIDLRQHAAEMQKGLLIALALEQERRS